MARDGETRDEEIDRQVKEFGLEGRFDGHSPIYETATIRGTLMEHLCWRRNGSSIDLVNYYCHNGVLMINGDLYDAIHYFNHLYGLTNISKCNLDYYMCKLRCGTDGSEGTSWDRSRAERWLDRFFKEDYDLKTKFAYEANLRACDDPSLPEDCTNDEFAALEAKYHEEAKQKYILELDEDPYDWIHSKEDWIQYFQEVGQAHEIFGPDAYNIGMTTTFYHLAHYVGLKLGMRVIERQP